MKNFEYLSDKIQSMPLSPGCYLFMDKTGNVLYVGKSKCLRKRTASYLRPQKDYKIEKMIMLAADVEYEPTKTDIEAMLLEYRLVKKYQPPFNAKMKKDRQAWYIQIDLAQTRPTFQILPEINDSLINIGSFPKVESAAVALEIIGKYWQLPTCGQVFTEEKRPCLRHQVKQCLAPCKGESEAYQSAVQKVLAFLRGDKTVLNELESQLQKATEALEFEKAAIIRDKYSELKKLSRQLENMPPDLRGKEYCLFLKSRHENFYILAYLSDGCVCAYFLSDSELITPDKADGLILANAFLEIDVQRKFADISHMHVNPENIKEILQTAFQDFIV